MTRTMPEPVWMQEKSGPRVLIEESDYAKQVALERILRERGYAVLGCGGPEATDDRCALVENHECGAVEGADVVVHALRSHDPRNREVLRSIRERYPDTPVVVEAPRPLVEREPADFDGCIVVYQPVTADSLVAAVESALGDA